MYENNVVSRRLLTHARQFVSNTIAQYSMDMGPQHNTAQSAYQSTAQHSISSKQDHGTAEPGTIPQTLKHNISKAQHGSGQSG